MAGFKTLFRPAAADSRRLFEPPFDFTDFGVFYNSDYFLDAAGLDYDSPALNATASLGDAWFEARYVSNEMQRIAGKRWIDATFSSDRAQMRWRRGPPTSHGTWPLRSRGTTCWGNDDAMRRGDSISLCKYH